MPLPSWAGQRLEWWLRMPPSRIDLLERKMHMPQRLVPFKWTVHQKFSLSFWILAPQWTMHLPLSKAGDKWSVRLPASFDPQSGQLRTAWKLGINSYQLGVPFRSACPEREVHFAAFLRAQQVIGERHLHLYFRNCNWELWMPANAPIGWWDLHQGMKNDSVIYQYIGWSINIAGDNRTSLWVDFLLFFFLEAVFHEGFTTSFYEVAFICIKKILHYSFYIFLFAFLRNYLKIG